MFINFTHCLHASDSVSSSLALINSSTRCSRASFASFALNSTRPKRFIYFYAFSRKLPCAFSMSINCTTAPTACIVHSLFSSLSFTLSISCSYNLVPSVLFGAQKRRATRPIYVGYSVSCCKIKRVPTNGAHSNCSLRGSSHVSVDAFMALNVCRTASSSGWKEMSTFVMCA